MTSIPVPANEVTLHSASLHGNNLDLLTFSFMDTPTKCCRWFWNRVTFTEPLERGHNDIVHTTCCEFITDSVCIHSEFIGDHYLMIISNTAPYNDTERNKGEKMETQEHVSYHGIGYKVYMLCTCTH